jgi:hypothetical protein
MITYIWITLLVVAGIVEIYTIFNKKPNDTFSEHIWRWFSIKKGTGKFKKTRRFILLVIMVWLAVHFLTGGWV